jgi:hypothetical protein
MEFNALPFHHIRQTSSTPITSVITLFRIRRDTSIYATPLDLDVLLPHMSKPVYDLGGLEC